MNVIDEANWFESPFYRDFVRSCHAASCKIDFCRVVNERLMQLVPHESFVCGFGNINTRHIQLLVNISFPDSFFKEVITKERYVRSPVLNQWIRERRLAYFDDDSRAIAEASSRIRVSEYSNWWSAFSAHNLRSVAGYGVADICSNLAFYFSMSGIEPPNKSSEFLFYLIGVHLQYALFNTHGDFASRPRDGNKHSLSRREQEILKWICQGKSNAEIAQILDVSSWTVKIHVTNVLRKLNASNRSHAVAKAVEGGIFPV